MKKLAVFDCDGTIVDSEYIACQVFPRIWTSMGLSMTTDEFICQFVGIGAGADIVQETLAKLPPGGMKLAEQEFEKQLRLSLEPVRGIPEMLAQLDMEMCVASNSRLIYLHEALEKTNLKKYFKKNVYSAHEVKNPKPAPDLFFHACKELNFSPKNCLVIEDSLAGIQAAKNAGMRVVGFMGGRHFNDFIKARLKTGNADYYCETTDELKKIIFDFKTNY